MSTITSLTSPPRLPELEEFVFHPDQFRKENIPRKLSPNDVANFMLTRIEKLTGLLPLEQAEKVIDFYDLYEVSGRFVQFLDQHETNSEEVRRAIVFTRIIARVGTPDHRNFARGYYLYLIRRANSTELLELLLSLLEALGPEGDPQPLRQATEHQLKTLEPQRASNSQLKHEYRRVERLSNFALPRTQQANAVKDRLLKMRNRQQRIDEEIRVYLGIRPGYPEYLPGWAARRLRHESWAEQPEQQITRVDDPVRRQELAQAFRRVAEEIVHNSHQPVEMKDLLRLSCLHAISFFGGPISEEEQNYLNAQIGKRFDILANE